MIRELVEADWPQVWGILRPVFAEGETYAYPRDIGEAQAYLEWVEKPSATLVAEDEAGRVVATYYLKPNQPGQGSHVCNCGYVVAAQARGRGIAARMCRHSQERARQAGFLAMQFNLVAATNLGAIALWQREGFETVGTLPGAFHSPARGYVDALVMFKAL